MTFWADLTNRSNLMLCVRTRCGMGTQVSIRGTAVRIAPHVWNRARDIDQLFDALEELLPKLAPSKL